jgi:hypothetical protein
MGADDTEPAPEVADGSEHQTVGRPYYSPEWGRWIVPLVPGPYRIADLVEILAARTRGLPAGSRIDRQTRSDRRQ